MISDLILIAKKFSVPSAYGRRDGVRDFFAQYPDGVYIATDAGAPAGWEGYAVWFGGTGERYAERFMEFIRDGYIVERFLRARVGGLLVFTFRCRLKMRRFGTLGKPNAPEPDALNFYMPNGGTISLNKTGTPTVVTLEYSLDRGATWTVWAEDQDGNRSLTLTAGQRMYVRNTSETSTRFSLAYNIYYWFSFNDITYARGNINSLICKNSENAILTSNCYRRLFVDAINLKTIPYLRSATLAEYCYSYTFYGCTGIIEPVGTIDAITLAYASCFHMFDGCSNMEKAPILLAESPATACYQAMFVNCISLKEIKIKLKTPLSVEDLSGWLTNVSPTGDFYCPAELTIQTGVSGIPIGWTRHDI